MREPEGRVSTVLPGRAVSGPGEAGRGSSEWGSQLLDYKWDLSGKRGGPAWTLRCSPTPSLLSCLVSAALGHPCPGQSLGPGSVDGERAAVASLKASSLPPWNRGPPADHASSISVRAWHSPITLVFIRVAVKQLRSCSYYAQSAFSPPCLEPHDTVSSDSET